MVFTTLLRVRGELLCFSRRHDTRDWENTSTSAFASASAPVSASASASAISTRQSHRKGIASQSEHLHLNPGVHKSQATIESLGPPQYSKAKHFPQYELPATEANIQRHLCSSSRRLRVMIDRIAVYILFGPV